MLTILGLCAVVSVYYAVRSSQTSVTKEDVPQLIDEAIRARDERTGILPPKTFEEILDATGMTCPEIGQAVCDKIKAAGEAIAEGRYADAVRMYEALIEVFSDVNDQPLKYNMGLSYYYAGKYYKACDIFAELLEKTSDDPAVLSGMGLALLCGGNYEQAESHINRAIEIGKKTLGEDHPDYAKWLNNLAELYRAQGKYGEAESLYERVLEINETALGENHPNMAAALNNHALLYKSQGKYAEAEPLYKRAIEIDKKALGPDHPDFAIDLNNLAEVYRKQGKYAEAEPLYKRALEIDEKALGPNEPGLATDLNNLAQLYRAQGKYAKAEPLFMRALAIFETNNLTGHSNFATLLGNVEIMYREWGKEEEARKYEKRLAEIKGESEQGE